MSSWVDTKNDLISLCQSDDERLPKGTLRKLVRLVDGMDEHKLIETSMSHGDFTPWNMYQKESTLQLYDWELANPMMPVGFDAFHFIIQQGILVDHLHWNGIEKEIRTRLTEETFARFSVSGKANLDEYLKLYLIMNTVYYLKTYSRQEVWHKQVSWLLRTWNEGLSCVLAKEQSPRALVLMDLFDFLVGKNYAALKFTDILPEQVSEFSDVDLCMDRLTSEMVSAYVSKHPLVAGVKRYTKSFMNTTQLVFADGSRLSLDMIWTIKRKSLVILDAETLLKNAYTNEHGVRVPQLLDNVRYIGLFYAMNHAHVPSKHKAYIDLLRSPENTLDGLLFAYFIGATLNTRSCIEYVVRQYKSNTGKAAWMNRLTYVIDTLKEFFVNKGMIITFSGVDGAGKSTVIDGVKQIFDKKQRRKVVVIRHRPSLLPILSTITKGKDEAERLAASRLPRQGTNRSFGSSLLRFGYYYTDYFFGQFYVYFRYVRRGYIVLYDRYYFDFIQDSRRSNIHLPAFITKLGYLFLMKPNMNFFLYADAGVIRERKQELDVETITQLTAQYRSLFEKLDAGNDTKRYVPVENINLDETLNTIMNLVTVCAA
jgi:thymidylate kinase